MEGVGLAVSISLFRYDHIDSNYLLFASFHRFLDLSYQFSSLYFTFCRPTRARPSRSIRSRDGLSRDHRSGEKGTECCPERRSVPRGVASPRVRASGQKQASVESEFRSARVQIRKANSTALSTHPRFEASPYLHAISRASPENRRMG